MPPGMADVLMCCARRLRVRDPCGLSKRLLIPMKYRTLTTQCKGGDRLPLSIDHSVVVTSRPGWTPPLSHPAATRGAKPWEPSWPSVTPRLRGLSRALRSEQSLPPPGTEVAALDCGRTDGLKVLFESFGRED